MWAHGAPDRSRETIVHMRGVLKEVPESVWVVVDVNTVFSKFQFQRCDDSLQGSDGTLGNRGMPLSRECF